MREYNSVLLNHWICGNLFQKSYRQPIKKQRRYFANKRPSNQRYGFSSSRVWMWELDYKESWVLKNWCFWTVVLEKPLWSPLDCKEIQPVHPKGDQPWVFIGRTDAEGETPILWPPDAKNWLIGKDPDAGKDGGQEEKGTTEDEMVGWHHQLDGHAFEQPSGVVMDREVWCAAVHGSQRVGHDWATELNWENQTFLPYTQPALQPHFLLLLQLAAPVCCLSFPCIASKPLHMLFQCMDCSSSFFKYSCKASSGQRSVIL